MSWPPVVPVTATKPAPGWPDSTAVVLSAVRKPISEPAAAAIRSADLRIGSLQMIGAEGSIRGTGLRRLEIGLYLHKPCRNPFPGASLPRITSTTVANVTFPIKSGVRTRLPSLFKGGKRNVRWPAPFRGRSKKIGTTRTLQDLVSYVG